MAHGEDMDRILSPWLYEDGASPPQASPAGPRPPASATDETRLLSTGSGAGSMTLTPQTMYACSGRLSALRGEVEADVNAATQSIGGYATGPTLQVTKAIAYVLERWEEKSKHLLSDMQERVDRVRKAADNWEKTEQDIKKALDKAGR